MTTVRARVLVTGGTGFAGSHLVRRLALSGADVHVFARPGSPAWRIADVLEGVTIWRGDLTDSVSVRECLRLCRPEVIFHLAADTESRAAGADFTRVQASLEINLHATLRLIAELQEGDWPVRSFVRTGGLEEYGSGPHPSVESQRESPVSPYSASQVAATHYCTMLQPYLRFPVVTIRPALIYGPAQSARFFIPNLISHCIEGRDLCMTSGNQGRDLIYVDDAVDALVRASAACGLGGEVINAGSGREYCVLDIAKAICSAMGAGIRLNIGATPERASEIRHLVCDSGKARQLLGWTPQTDFTTGLALTVEWYRRHAAAAHQTAAPR